MKYGMARKVDDLGRISIPKAIRKEAGIAENDTVKIFYDEKKDSIIIKKMKDITNVAPLI